MFLPSILIAFINIFKITVKSVEIFGKVGYYKSIMGCINRIIWFFYPLLSSLNILSKHQRLNLAWRKYSFNCNHGGVTSQFFAVIRWRNYVEIEYRQRCNNASQRYYNASQPSSCWKISMQSYIGQSLMGNVKVRVKNRSKQLLSSVMTEIPII